MLIGLITATPLLQKPIKELNIILLKLQSNSSSIFKSCFKKKVSSQKSTDKTASKPNF